MERLTTTKGESIRKETRNEFSIPVYPHVRKFMVKKFKASKAILTTEHSTIGMLVTAALRDNQVKTGLGKVHEMNVRPETREKLTDELTLILTKRQTDYSVRLSKLIVLNNYFDRMFKEHMLTFMEAQGAVGFPAYAACRNFLKFYDILESEYSLESAYRYYQNQKPPK